MDALVLPAALLQLRDGSGAAPPHPTVSPAWDDPARGQSRDKAEGERPAKERLDAAGDSGEARQGQPLFTRPCPGKACSVAQISPAPKK